MKFNLHFHVGQFHLDPQVLIDCKSIQIYLYHRDKQRNESVNFRVNFEC